MNKSICEKIRCPYWSGASNRYGCQAYATAGLCHLHGKTDKLERANQYGLYPSVIRDSDYEVVGAHEVTEIEVEALKQINDKYWLDSKRYAEDRAMDELRADRPRWNVGEIVQST